MNKIKMPYFIIAILFGISFFIYGGIDDSPGAQLLAVIVIIVSIVGIVRKLRNS